MVQFHHKINNDFLDANENTIVIINEMEPHLIKHFSDTKFSLEVCKDLGWTIETKLLSWHCLRRKVFQWNANHFKIFTVR